MRRPVSTSLEPLVESPDAPIERGAPMRFVAPPGQARAAVRRTKARA
jgi:hypothetical protein